MKIVIKKMEMVPVASKATLSENGEAPIIKEFVSVVAARGSWIEQFTPNPYEIQFVPSMAALLISHNSFRSC